MRTIAVLLAISLVCVLASCFPPPNNGPVVQPDGGVLTDIETINQTVSGIRAWGQGPAMQTAKTQAGNAAAKAMLKNHAGSKINVATQNSGWQAIVNRTCTLETEGPQIEYMSGGVKWTGVVSCRRQELIDWFNETVGGGVAEEVADVDVPRIVIMPARMFGEITDFEMTEDEKYCYTEMQNIFLKRSPEYEIANYETLIRGWKGAITAKTGNINLDPSFAIEADVYIKFDINVDRNDPGMIKASCVVESIFVSVGSTAASKIGNSVSMQNTEANRKIAIRDAAANGIDKIYDGMMKKWANELKKGFYFRIIIQGMTDDAAIEVSKALKAKVLGDAPLKLNESEGEMWDISIYVKKEFGSFLPMLGALNEAVAPLGFKLKKEYVKYHALIFTLNRAD